jgi:hypothetical protein
MPNVEGGRSLMVSFPEAGTCDLHPVCLSVYVCVFPPLTFESLASLYETSCVCHGNWAHLNGALHKSLPSVCVPACVFLLMLQDNSSVKCNPPFDARQQLGAHVPSAMNTRNNRNIVGRIIFYAVCVVSEESLWISLYVPVPLLGNSSVKTLPWRRRIVGSVVLHAARVVTKEFIIIIIIGGAVLSP